MGALIFAASCSIPMLENGHFNLICIGDDCIRRSATVPVPREFESAERGLVSLAECGRALKTQIRCELLNRFLAAMIKPKTESNRACDQRYDEEGKVFDEKFHAS